MSRRGRRSRFRHDEVAVSVMVGALLLVGIFVASMITIRVSYVPAWEEDREATTARAVAREFSIIKAEQDRLVTNGSALALTQQLTLTERSDSMFRLPTVPSTLEYIDGNRIFRISATDLNILDENGTDYTRLNETYDPVHDTHGDEIYDLGSLLTLRLRLDEVRSGFTYNNSQLLVDARDTDGAFAGSFRVWLDDSGPGFRIVTETRDRWTTLLHSGSTGYVDGTVVAPFYVDAHDPQYRFTEVLRAAPGPYDLNLTHTFLPGTSSYTLSYTQSGSGGTIIRTSGGFADASYQQLFVGGTLKHTAHNRYFVENGWRLEHGALLLIQSDGAIMHSGPKFSVGLVRDDILRVSLVLPEGTGDGSSIAGVGSTAVSMQTEETYRLIAEAPEFTFNLTTDHPSVWAAHWNRTLMEAGLSGQGASPQFSTTTGTNWVALRLIGFGGPGEQDIYLDLHQGKVRYTIQG